MSNINELVEQVEQLSKDRIERNAEIKRLREALAVYEASVQGVLNRVTQDWPYRSLLDGGSRIGRAREIGREALEGWVGG